MEPVIITQEEASNFIASVENKISKRLLTSAIHCVVVRYMKNPTSARSDIDLEFLAIALLPFCENHQAIQEILNGEPLLFEGEFEEQR
jgi:hypothetical protein